MIIKGIQISLLGEQAISIYGKEVEKTFETVLRIKDNLLITEFLQSIEEGFEEKRKALRGERKESA